MTQPTKGRNCLHVRHEYGIVRSPIRRNTGRGVCGGVIFMRLVPTSREEDRFGMIGKVLAFVRNGRYPERTFLPSIIFRSCTTFICGRLRNFEPRHVKRMTHGILPSKLSHHDNDQYFEPRQI
ncbi:hypothetical protein TNCV_2080071 [Trichonephila clavipes]|nr:hypothetical protein TNCV_2080071 [Trichonephila clavipes]